MKRNSNLQNTWSSCVIQVLKRQARVKKSKGLYLLSWCCWPGKTSQDLFLVGKIHNNEHKLHRATKRPPPHKKNTHTHTLKAPLKDFNISNESRKETALDLLKWRCLINKGAANNKEKKRTCEAERKYRERKA